MTRSWEREQWMRNCKREEYRELLSALSASSIDMMEFVRTKAKRPDLPIDQLFGPFKAGARTIADRIYIADEVARLNLGERYMEISSTLLQLLGKDDADSAVVGRINELIGEIITSARKI